MKFQKQDVFDKHLLEGGIPAPLYIIVHPRLEERKILLEHTARLVTSQALVRTESAEEALALLTAPNLFGDKGFVLLAEAKKEIAPLLKSYLQNPSKECHLFLGLEQEKIASELYLAHKRDIILLDLSKETPWERKERLKSWLLRRAKTLKPAAADRLLERFSDMAQLDQELHKLICFVGPENEITSAAIDAICTPQVEEVHGFQLAESLAWGRLEKPVNVTEVLPLIGQLRYVLELSLAISSLYERGEGRAAFTRLYPQVHGRVVDKYCAKAPARPPRFYIAALAALYEMELSAKRSLADGQLLFDRFCAQLQEST